MVSVKHELTKLALRLWVRLDATYLIENWKHCNKIIFKCVNSTVGPIFYIFFLNKVIMDPANSIWIVHEQYSLSLKCVHKKK